MKKFFALMMALAMTLALAVPMVQATFSSSADALTSSGEEKSYGGQTIVPTITVEVSYSKGSGALTGNAKLLLNPYGKKYTAAPDGGAMFEGYENAQVMAPPVVVASKSDSAVALIVKGAVATKAGVANLVAKAPTTKATATLDAYLYLLGEEAPDEKGKFPGDYDKDHAILLSNYTATNTDSKTLYVIPASEGGSTGTANYGQLGIGGALATNVVDTNGVVTWTTADTVALSYTLLIKAAVE